MMEKIGLGWLIKIVNLRRRAQAVSNRYILRAKG
jgi:hypothetical protein